MIPASHPTVQCDAIKAAYNTVLLTPGGNAMQCNVGRNPGFSQPLFPPQNVMVKEKYSRI